MEYHTVPIKRSEFVFLLRTADGDYKQAHDLIAPFLKSPLTSDETKLVTKIFSAFKGQLRVHYKKSYGKKERMLQDKYFNQGMRMPIHLVRPEVLQLEANPVEEVDEATPPTVEEVKHLRGIITKLKNENSNLKRRVAELEELISKEKSTSLRRISDEEIKQELDEEPTFNSFIQHEDEPPSKRSLRLRKKLLERKLERQKLASKVQLHTQLNNGGSDADTPEINDCYDEPFINEDDEFKGGEDYFALPAGCDYDGYSDSGTETGHGALLMKKRKLKVSEQKTEDPQSKPRKSNALPKDPTNSVCLQCNKDFKNPSHLKDHQLSHLNLNDIPLHMCPQCGQTFKYERNLTRHMNIHKEETEKHVCETCKKEFSRIADMKRHELTHSEEKEFVCQFCSKGFTRRHLLFQHERLHIKEFPYSCQYAGCDKAYTTKSALDYHRNHHHPKENEDLTANINNIDMNTFQDLIDVSTLNTATI